MEISCSEPGWLDSLGERYRLFSGEQFATCALHVHTCAQLFPYPADYEEIFFQGENVLLRSRTFEGTFDTAEGKAEIWVHRNHPVENIDYYLRVIYSLLIFNAGGILFHGAGIEHQGKGYLFFGHSGVGKSTISRLSMGDIVLNDDLVALMPWKAQPDSTSNSADSYPKAWSMHATPFWNPTQVKPTRHSSDLAAMFQLVQDKRVHLRPLSRSLASAELLASVPVIVKNAAFGVQLLERLEAIQESVPVYNLHFLPDASFWMAVEYLSNS